MTTQFLAGGHSCRVLDRRAALKSAAAAGLAWVGMSFVSYPLWAAQDLLVFDFTGYDVADLHQAYIRKYGASPSYTLYGDCGEAFQRPQPSY